MIASKADIIAYESLGFSHLTYRGESYFVNLNSESSRSKFKNYLGKLTGKDWGIAELERCVFYRKDMYFLDRSNLRLNDTFQGKVDVPINTNSCAFMFFSKNLEGIDFSDFDTSGIEDMNSMFSYCTFPEGFSLGDKFDTSSVKDMGNMFCDASFNESFNLGDKFDTSNIKNMFGIFSGTQFNEDFRLAKSFTICKESRDMFLDAKLPSRVAKQVSSEVIAKEIVELLKSV